MVINGLITSASRIVTAVLIKASNLEAWLQVLDSTFKLYFSSLVADATQRQLVCR
jgi:putative heme degradation protein